MMRVSGQAIAHHLGIYFRAARFGVLILFQHDDASALAHHETVAIDIIWARTPLRLVVKVKTQGFARRETGNRHAADRRFRPAGDHYIGVPEHDEAACVANGMRAGGARRDNGMVGAFEAMADGDLAGGEIDQASGNEKRRHAARALIAQCIARLDNAFQPANARANQNARGNLVFIARWMPVSVIQRLLRGSHCIDDEIINFALLFRLHEVIRIESAAAAVSTFDLAGDLAGEIIDLEVFDPRRAIAASYEARPCQLSAHCERRHHANTGYDNASHRPPPPQSARCIAWPELLASRRIRPGLFR